MSCEYASSKSANFGDHFQFLDDYDIREDQKHLIEQIGYEVIIMDRDYKVVYANHNTLERYGSNIVGKKCFDIFPYDKDDGDGPCENCPCFDFFNDDKTQVARYRGREMIDVKGNQLFVGETSTPLLSRDGKCALVVTVMRDITKRIKLERLKFELQGDFDYQQSIQRIVDGLKGIGYKRVRFYDFVHDSFKNNEGLFAIRYTQGMGDKDFTGYRFYENETAYLPNIGDERRARIRSGKRVIAENPGCKWLKDYGLEKGKFIDLPLVVSDKLVGVIGRVPKFVEIC